MTWLLSFTIALIIGLLGGIFSLWFSDRCVRWYRISSFEGNSGYFVLFSTLLGTLVSAIVGLMTSRVVLWLTNDAAGFGTQLAWAVGVLATLAGTTALLARSLADVPPTINGKPLDLLVEFRLPASQVQKPSWDASEVKLTLGSVKRIKPVMRASQDGSLALDRARLEDGRWTIQGRVGIFTSRGRKTISIQLADKREGFLVPLPRHPSVTDLTWSEWLPYPRPDGKPAINTITYRFRVVPAKA